MSRAGILKDRLTFLEMVTVKNEYLEDESTWEPAFTAKGNLKHTGGGKSENQDERLWVTQKDFTMRDQWPVDTSMRVEIDGRMFEILDIQPSKYQSKFLTIKLNRIND